MQTLAAMSQVISRVRDRAPSPSVGRVVRPAADTSLDIILKLVPLEVITVYAAATAFGLASSAITAPLLLLLGILATPLALRSHGQRVQQPVPLAQHVVRTLSFIAWAFAVGNPLAPQPPIERWIPAVAILVIPVLGSFLFPPATMAPPRPGDRA